MRNIETGQTKRVLFVRHGESRSNVDGTFAGRTDDSPLTPTGEQQARTAGAQIKTEEIRIDRIIASPLKRALHTAELIADTIGFDPAQIEIDERLSEYDMGILTGKPCTKITSAELVAARGAEDPHLFMARAVAALDDVTDYPGTVLFVTHAGTLRAIRCAREHIDPTAFYDLPTYKNATVFEL